MCNEEKRKQKQTNEPWLYHTDEVDVWRGVNGVKYQENKKKKKALLNVLVIVSSSSSSHSSKISTKHVSH
jgi:hypothetical protein